MRPCPSNPVTEIQIVRAVSSASYLPPRRNAVIILGTETVVLTLKALFYLMTTDKKESCISVRYLLLKVVFNEVKEKSWFQLLWFLIVTRLVILKLGIFFVINENGFEENGFFLISIQILL